MVRTTPFATGVRKTGLLVAACLVVLSISGQALGFRLDTNLQNLAFVNALCGPGETCQSPLLPDAHLAARDMLSHHWRQVEDLTACQALWLSRLQASSSLEAAGATLDRAQKCSYDDLVTAWRADLAWTRGQDEIARTEWDRLTAPQLVERSYWLMLQDDTERARAMLQVALSEKSTELPPAKVKRLHAVLGHSFRLEGNWAEALEQYDKAWRLDPGDSEMVFFLAMSYRETGQPLPAAHLLEQGLHVLPARSPGFAATYMIQLGSAYRELEKPAQALAAFQQAKQWVQKESPPWIEQETFIDRAIADLQARLEGKTEAP